MGLLDIFKRKSKPKTAPKAITIRPSYTLRSSIPRLRGDKFTNALNYPSGWDLDHGVLRQRSRIAYWDSVQARALIGRLTDNTINTGLKLEAAPIWEHCWRDATEEDKRTWLRDTETRFHLFMNSKDLDAAGQRTGYQLQFFDFLNKLKDGETIKLLRYSADREKQNPLELQYINPDQIQDPLDQPMKLAVKARGNKIVDGIEVNSANREIAIYVFDDETRKSTRIPKRGPKSGRIFYQHSAITDSVGQVRGIPVLANLVHELQKLTDYTIAELESAIINATIAAWIKPSADKDASRALQGVKERTAATPTTTGDTPPTTGDIKKPGLLIQTLKAGEELESYDTKRPNVNFEDFLKAIKSSLSASLGLPVEVLDMSFNANYSASRASLILFWNVVEKRRVDFAADFLNPIYEAWMREEIAASRIKAPGWESIIMRRAWLNCSWVGINKPSIDPLKEAKAATERIAQGLTTRERESKAYNGSEFTENIERLKLENADLAEAKKSLPGIPAPGRNGESDKDELKEEIAESVLEELR